MKIKTTSLLLIGGMIVSSAEESSKREDSGRQSRIPRSLEKGDSRDYEHERKNKHGADDDEIEVRSYDGSGNNIANPLWGAAHQPFIRLFENGYSDGSSSPAGENRPSARVISNAVAAQSVSTLNSRGATDFLWQWGQFIDHDITETPTVDPAEPFNVDVPAGDFWFDPQVTGAMIIPLNRSLFEDIDGVREQINAITSYIDASHVYGSDETRAIELRTNDGSGKLNTSESEFGDLLPYNTGGFHNAGDGPEFFLAGDIRANEQVGLTALHTLFVREHNYWAERYAEQNPDATGEDIYQFARNIVAAEMQAITYREFLPVLLGKKAIPEYRGYDSEVQADISNEFAGASFRVGHTLLSSTLLRLNADGEEIEAGHLSLAGAFFNPSATEDNGIAVTLRGLATQQCQELDEMLVDDVRNFLFGAPGSGGLDLASLNIQRGRDHGLPSYNLVREGFGMRAVDSFDDVSSTAADRLAAAYDSPDDLDLWIASLCEDPIKNSMVGPVLFSILKDQFVRLRDGDRFYYKNTMSKKMVKFIEEQTLATIIRRNTEIDDEIEDNVFLVEDAPTVGPVPSYAQRSRSKGGNKRR